MPLTPEAHPGTMKMIDMFTKSVKEVAIEDVPESRRFVYLKDGVEVSSADEADEIIPIVETRMYPFAADGELVAKEDAHTIRMQELGPDDRPLRSTTMVKD